MVIIGCTNYEMCSFTYQNVKNGNDACFCFVSGKPYVFGLVLFIKMLATQKITQRKLVFEMG